MQLLSYVRLYNRHILGRPHLILSLLFVFFAFFLFQIKNFRLDASADSLLLEQDQDLKYYRTISSRFQVEDFLLLIHKPNDENILSNEALQTLKSLRDDLAKIERVSSVLTILDIPLFKSPPVSLKEFKTKHITLLSPEVDKKLAGIELQESPLFRNLLVSPDMKATAIVINFQRNKITEDLLEKRSKLRDKKYAGTITAKELLELNQVSANYQFHHDLEIKQIHQDIKTIRAIMNKYTKKTHLFLGGVSMITNDMIAFIKNDLKIFGIGIFLFLIIALGSIFRRIPWVILPMACCLLSVIVMMGGMGLYGWEVTVVSSNFISLQLIFTMALTIHLIVRFNEVLEAHPDLSNRHCILQALYTIFKPCVYTTLTTIAGFCSLVVCDILPVSDFGWMMAMGLCISFIVTFSAFPLILLLFHKTPPIIKRHFHFSMTLVFANFTKNHGTAIFVISGLVFAATIVGICSLKVENSFIGYFKKNTEIYQGMKFVDQNLGGTTPLDVIINFEAEEIKSTNTTDLSGEEVFDEFAEFEEKTDEKYWFTTERMELIKKVHNYLDSQVETGKVLSLNTIVEFADQLSTTDKKPWDNFTLALLFKELPEEIKKAVVDPFVSIENNQTRITVRMKDSLKSLQRDLFLKRIQKDLSNNFGLKKEQVHLTNLMVLYNNVLQSLFKSQIQTIGVTVFLLMIMFLILFRSFKISLIAILPNLLSCLVILGVMGLVDIPLDMMTITIVAISIGIAVDNTIHYLHRFKREFKQDYNYLETMFRCHASIGNAMYYTSMTVIVGFSILALSNFIPTLLFGLLTGLAMLIALLSSLTLLPKLIIVFKLFGPEKDVSPERRKTLEPLQL